MLTTRSGKQSNNQPVNDATTPAGAVATSPDQSSRDITTSDPLLLKDDVLLSVDLDRLSSEDSTAKGTASGAASGVQAEAENDNVQAEAENNNGNNDTQESNSMPGAQTDCAYKCYP